MDGGIVVMRWVGLLRGGGCRGQERVRSCGHFRAAGEGRVGTALTDLADNNVAKDGDGDKNKQRATIQ